MEVLGVSSPISDRMYVNSRTHDIGKFIGLLLRQSQQLVFGVGVVKGVFREKGWEKYINVWLQVGEK